MTTFATVPIAAVRVGPCLRTFTFVGLDLSGVALSTEVRLQPDTPGAPLLALGAVAQYGEGIEPVVVTHGGPSNIIPTSVVTLRINEATLQDATKMPYSGEIGDASVLSYALVGAFGSDNRLLVQGTLTLLPTTFGSTNAPAGRPQGYGAAGSGGIWTGAQLTFSNDAITVALDGLDLLQPTIEKVGQAAVDAGAARDQAVAAAATMGGLASLTSYAGRLRLKASLFYGAARQIMAADPVTVTNAAASTLAGGVAIPFDDARVRVLGGKRVVYYPTFSSIGHATSYTANIASSQIAGFEFTAPSLTFEVVTSNAGGGYMGVEIDGIATNDLGYQIGAANDGSTTYAKVTLPAGSIGKRIRLQLMDRPWAGLILPAGTKLGDPPARIPSSMVVIGNSIPEGTGSTRPWKAVGMQVAYRLGIDNPVISGSGSTGYLATRDLGGGNHTFTYRQRIADVLQAVNGGPPDLLLIPGGAFNDADGFAPAAIQAEALAYFQALRAAAPEMVIVAAEPFVGYGDPGGNTNALAARDAVFAAAAQVSGVYTVDLTDMVTMANRDAIFAYGGGDGTHPVDAGHALYGQVIASRVKPVIGGL